jgi:hypothetical protein
LRERIVITVQRSNPNWVDKVRRKLALMPKREVAIGFPRGMAGTGKVYPNGATVLQVAVWNNFGTEGIPARPFMLQATPKIKAACKAKLKEFAKALRRRGKGATADQMERILQTLGLLGKDVLRGVIGSGNFLPNAPYTIRKKGSSVPLIDTGIMRKSVSYVVRDAR